MIYVCSLWELDEHAAKLRPARLISIISPEEQPPTPSGITAEAHLRVACHDIVAPFDGEVVPDARHVEQIIAFAGQWDCTGSLLVHCQAGISRSTAAALISYAVHFPDTIEQAAGHLRRAAAYARPNPLIVALGDRLLGMRGRLVSAVEAMGPAEPALQGILVNIPHPQQAVQSPAARDEM
jgi:predicted protein tyrosine phosphatase